jgi:dTDP-4-amino-4,6-dideoxygalactose transaminase
MSSIDRTAVPFVDIGEQTRKLREEILAAVDEVLTQSNFILGSHVGKFEEEFARYVGTKYAVGTASGLDALRLALAASGIGPGDEVIVPAHTFIATALAVSEVGARPVFVDCDRETYNIDVGRIRDAITERTKGIIPVHFAGLPAEMDGVTEIAERHGLRVIEDAAQAHGARYRGRRTGSTGGAGCFSFYPSKNLGACGDGGIVTTDDEQLARRLRRLRHYGQEEKNRHLERGVNSRLDTLQAAILSVKLRHLDEWNAVRIAHAARYERGLAGAARIQLPGRVPHATHVYHLYIVETDDRDGLQRRLAEHGVQTGVHYPLPIHLQPAYADLGYARGSFPVAERAAERMLSLPMSWELRPEQIERAAEVVRDWADESPAPLRRSA